MKKPEPVKRTIRLNRYLAQSGLGSRRAVEDLIKSGKVKVNGEVAELTTQIVPGRDRVETAGRIVKPPEQGKTYLLLNKPRGYDVTRDDTHSHRRAYDLLPKGTHSSVAAAGRLDRDSTGLLLFTNDGDLAYRLTHPRYGCPKTYIVEVEGSVTREEVGLLLSGVQLDDGPAAAIRVDRMGEDKGVTALRIVMTEGRKRIVRRMCEAIGHPVVSLHRTAMGPLTVDGVARGKTRPLLAREIAQLRQSVGLAQEKMPAKESASKKSPRRR